MPSLSRSPSFAANDDKSVVSEDTTGVNNEALKSAFNAVVKATQTNFNNAVQQVKDICSHLSHAVKGGEDQTFMSRVKEGFIAVATLGPALANVGVRFAGKGIDKLVDKHPVLAMAAGVAGLIGGIVLCTHEPFTGMALTTAAAYTILKSYKPVHEKLMAALNKSKTENKNTTRDTPNDNLPKVDAGKDRDLGIGVSNNSEKTSGSPHVIIPNQEEAKSSEKKDL